MEINSAVVALAALAQETRLSVYRMLVEAGPDGLAAGRLADGLSVASASLSFHLKELLHAGLVRSRQDGRYVIYSANYEAMNALLGYLTENCCRGTTAACSPIACCGPAKP
ncbi:helix-turn-helix transcriptional regulator [uncultured Nevskia sp.]|uniref:ArsR/SmtB family transcription factor n=1 Tax=uncultured Nevskia sp. TaxID=228950 RepID=UPI0025FB63A3|nr:metalloregulator ArsR/SmtB family transcription factor [uncultured Nevskia sp.]